MYFLAMVNGQNRKLSYYTLGMVSMQIILWKYRVEVTSKTIKWRDEKSYNPAYFRHFSCQLHSANKVRNYWVIIARTCNSLVKSNNNI
jgi:hypothetical protein